MVGIINLFVIWVNLKNRKTSGEVAEWLKVLAWKASVPHKGTAGSNPALSAVSQLSNY